MYDNVEKITNEETIEYLDLYKKGNEEYFEKIILGYIPLVKYIVSTYFQGNFDFLPFDDFVSIGIIGLMRAINYYDSTRNAKFSTFAFICIKSELLRVVNRRKSINCLSLDNNFIMEEALLIPDNTNLENDYIEYEMFELLKNNLKLLTNTELEFISDVYGFYKKRLTLQELANKYKCSRGTIERRTKKIVNKLKFQLLENGYDEITNLHI